VRPTARFLGPAYPTSNVFPDAEPVCMASELATEVFLMLLRPWQMLPFLAVVSFSVVLAAGGNRALADDAQDPTSSQAAQLEQRRKKLAEEKELLRLFADTLEQVKSKYVDSDVSDRELIEAAIRGMISKLDPYSNYIAPNELNRFLKGIQREFVGIGIEVSIRNGNLQIVSPMFGTPAWRAGLRAGDRILRINETSTRGMSIDDAIKLMTGEVGSDVTVTVLHADGTEPETVALRRERIHQPTVLGYHRHADGQWDYLCDQENRIAYIRVVAFSQNTSKDLRTVLDKLTDEKLNGLVLDLRFNPGGMLTEAIQVSDFFVRQGKIVSITGRGTENRSWDARDEGTLIQPGFPMAVLVNRFSASAAEIVSACLQDNDVAVVVGERTWGKASVQNIIELEQGKSALKLTTAGYQRPSGKNIHRKVGAGKEDEWGVKPNDGYEIRYDNADLANLSALFSELDDLKKPHPTSGDDDSPPGSENRFVDSQLQKALDVVRDRAGIAAATDNDVPSENVPAAVGTDSSGQ
jgi:carboxyl-terminal processing protease